MLRFLVFRILDDHQVILRFEVLMVVYVRIKVLWNVILCTMVDRWRQCVPLKHWLPMCQTSCVTSQKTVILVVTTNKFICPAQAFC
jgi:hypothetical protein